MRKVYYIILVFLFYSMSGNGQTNITQNFDMESGGSCVSVDDLDHKFNANTIKIDNWANPKRTGWFQGNGTSQLFCNNSLAFSADRYLYIHINPTNDYGYWKEFVVNQLLGNGVVEGNEYVFRMKISFNKPNPNLSGIAILLSSKHPTQKRIAKGGTLKKLEKILKYFYQMQ